MENEDDKREDTDPKNDPPLEDREPPSDRPPVDEPPPAEAELEAKKKVVLEPAYKSDPRNEIFARHNERNRAEKTESDAVFTEAVTRRAEPTDQAGAETKDQGLADAGRKVKIVVYGQEREVPESDVIEAGRRYLQKDAAADHKMSEAASREAALREEEQRLLRVADNLRKGLDEHGQPLVAQPPAKGAASRKISKDKLEAVSTAVYSGDTEALTAALQSYTDDVIATLQAGGEVAPEVLQSIEDKVLANVEARRRSEAAGAEAEADRQAANRVFIETVGDLHKDPVTMAMARGLSQHLVTQPEWAERGQVEIAREVGRQIRERMGPNTAEGQLRARREAKQDLPASSAAKRHEPPPEGPRIPSNREYVEQLRRNSGSNTTLIR